jgi:hypothetical protein
MNRLRLLAALATLPATSACVSAEDDPSVVKDLRILAISTESPELMASDCTGSPNSLAVLGSPVTFTALIADPAGGGRQLRYQLLACAWPGNRDCSTAEDAATLAEGLTTAGELVLAITPGLTVLADGTPLIQRVIEQDTYRGLGGVRMPLVLHLFTRGEGIYAQKLMVFSCRRFPEMMPNATPRLSGLRVNGEGWGEEVLQLRGLGPFKLNPEDFTAVEEKYVVPSLDLQPVHLKESWKLSWHTDFGKISPTETGGTDVGGQEGRHLVEWKPASSVQQDVNLWVVVRDGRGGVSWLKRRARYSP